MPELLQDVIVTAIAAAAATMIGWRVFGFLGGGADEPGCSSCPSAKASCTPQAQIPLSSLRNRKDTPGARA